MTIEELFKPSSGDVWSNYVPLITEKNQTKAFLTDAIEDPSNYNELCYKLKTASAAEVFTLYINTPGGIIDSATMIIDAIKTSKAKVIANISGTVASAGTILTLACDEVIIADHTAFMIHNYSGGLQGKGHEMKARQEFIDASLNASFKEFYKDFLTEDEMEDVIDGKDMWMGKDEVVARLKGTFHTKGIDDEPKAKRGRPKKKA